MARYRLITMRICGIMLILLLFGLEFLRSIADYGKPHADASVGAYVFFTVMGLLAILAVWSASRFRDADQVAVVMVALLLVGLLLRLVIDHVAWLSVAGYGLIILGGLVLTFGRGKSDDELPLIKWRQFGERRALPRINQRRQQQGLAPAGSIQQIRDEIPPAKRRRRRWLTGFSVLVVIPNANALVGDMVHQGQPSNAADYPFIGLLALGVGMAVLVIGAWWFSDFKYRTAVLVLEVILDFGVMTLYANGTKTTISGWDIAEDLAWLALATAQMRDSERRSW